MKSWDIYETALNITKMFAPNSLGLCAPVSSNLCTCGDSAG